MGGHPQPPRETGRAPGSSTPQVHDTGHVLVRTDNRTMAYIKMMRS